VRQYRTESEAETVELGRQLARELPARAVVLLIGDLGAGKTTLAKGIVEGLGAAPQDDVLSPTFTLVHEYDERTYHLDLYRLETQREVEALGIDELLTRDVRVLVEWGERFPEIWPDDRIELRLQARDDTRTIQISGLPEPPLASCP
jgi:tRNA threonylcarbamoyladenosine biosynthesis protein TsaE